MSEDREGTAKRRERPRLDLGFETIRAWHAVLPPDFRAAVEAPAPVSAAGGEAAVSAFSAEVETAGVEGAGALVVGNPALFAAMGIARRLRLLAWLTSRSWPDAGRIVRALIDESAGESGAILRADAVKLAPKIAARQARRIFHHETLGAVSRASFDMVGGMEVA